MSEKVTVREPVLTAEVAEQLNRERLDQQWGLITQAIQQELYQSPEVRKILMEYTKIPVTENLPQQVIDRVRQKNARIDRLCQRYEDECIAYLKLPSVPDHALKPDITLAPIASEGELDSEHVTKDEKTIVAHRYKLARDLKLLALGAELFEHPPNTSSNISKDTESFRLPSGIEITLSGNDLRDHPELIQPELWERRQQLKDRVHIILVGGKKFILKERKTDRHVDTKEYGHKDGLTSQKEFEVARLFEQKGQRSNEYLRLSWEKPVGCVTYPDGFQFALFQWVPGLKEERQAPKDLMQQIETRRAEFEQEYQAVKILAREFYFDHRIHDDDFHGEQIPTAWLRRQLVPKQAVKEFDFEAFARVKTSRLLEQAEEMRKIVVEGLGYSNSDDDGFACRFPKKGPLMEVIGFDFEYLRLTGPAAEDADVKKRHTDNPDYVHIPLVYGNRMERAAYLAMHQLEEREDIDRRFLG